MPCNELSLCLVRNGKLLKDSEFQLGHSGVWKIDLKTRLITENSVKEVTALVKR